MNIFAISNIIVGTSYKYIALGGVHLVVFIFFRSMFTLTSATIDLIRTGTNPFNDIPDENWIKRKIALRAFFGNSTFVLFNAALPYVPIFITRVLLQLSPLWITVLSYCVNGESVHLNEFIGICICLGAVSLIAYNQTQHQDKKDAVLEVSNTIQILAILSLLLGGFMKANSDLLSRSLKNVNVSVILFYHGCLGLAVMTTILLCSPHIKITGHTQKQYFLLAIAVVFSTIAVNASTIAF